MKPENIEGQTFGRWTVIGPMKRQNRQSYWRCRCECGREKFIYLGNLKRGKSRSCGCLSVEITVAHFKTHGAAPLGAIRPEYRSWQHMKDRCLNPNNAAYDRYGARGITVFVDWIADFAAFFEHIGPRPSSRHSVDRIDNDRGYEPGNVRWATDSQQVRNRRDTRRGADGTPIFDLRESAGVSKSTYARRIRAGWSQEAAATTPARDKVPNGRGHRFGKL